MDLEELKLLRKQRNQLKRLAELKAEFGLLFYTPHEKQKMFHAAGEYKYRLLECANRFGKSEAGAAEICAWARGARVWLDPNDPAYSAGINQKPNRILVVCVDWDKVDDIFTGEGKKGGTGKLWTYLPKKGAKAVSKTTGGIIDKIQVESIHGGHSLICFDTGRSFALNPKGSESSNWDFILIDEPITKPHWSAVSRGLVDTNGKAAFTCTNLDQPWISDFFRSNPKRKEALVEHKTKDGFKQHWTLRGSMRDNPHLSEEAVREFEESLSEDEKACRIHGVPLHLSGLVYKEFNEQLHVLKQLPAGWRDWRLPPTTWPHFVACDTHPKTPHATLFGVVGPHDTIYIYDERFVADTAVELAQYIHKQTAGRYVVSWRLDPSAFVPDAATKTVFANVFHQNGLPFLKASKDLSGGIQMVKQYLKTRLLFFSPQLTRTLWEIEHYTWSTSHGIATNRPKDADDHMMECLYRIVIQQPKFHEVAGTISNYQMPDITSVSAFDGFEDPDWDYLTKPAL